MLSWEEMSGPQLSRLLSQSEGDVGLLPVGATEQHGPHLPTGTDSYIATGICSAVAERTGAVVLPVLSVGASFGHGRLLGGTLSFRPQQLAESIVSVCDWAGASGLRRIIAINAHMGNGSAIGMAGDLIRFERPDLRFGAVDWWAADPAVADECGADGSDIHANRTETAVMLALRPDLVRADEMGGADDPDRTAGLVFRYTAESLSTNGVTGRPSEATPDLGRRLVALTVAAIAAMVERGRREEPPLVGHRLLAHAGTPRC